MKRPNPFIEDFIPQSKVHVGPKQFNSSEGRLQEVYEKTLGLLYKGAKKCGSNVLDSSNVKNLDKKDTMKQLIIGKNGTLLQSGEPITLSSKLSQLCSCGIASETACAYCERSLCPNCHHHCIRCNHYYCSACSLVREEGTEICVSCYD